MGMPDTGYIEYEMFSEVFSQLPNLRAVAWTDSQRGAHSLEFRFNETFEDLPYDNGNIQNKDDKGYFDAVASTLASFPMLRGYDQSEEDAVSIRKREDFILD